MITQLDPLTEKEILKNPRRTIDGNQLDYFNLIAKDAPLYVQIRENLRYQLLSGVYNPGDKIPSEQEVADKWGVNRLTARRSINSLADEGFLCRKQGCGTYVVDRKQSLNEESALTSFWEIVTSLGMSPYSKVVACELLPAPEIIANKIEIGVGDPIFKIQRIRMANDEPFAFHINYFPAYIIPNLLQENLENQSLYGLYRKHGYFPTYGEQRISAIAAEADISSYLCIKRKSPVLFIERVTRGTDRKPLEFMNGYYQSDKYSVFVNLHI
jgi:GntR family transcriptional regulator